MVLLCGPCACSTAPWSHSTSTWPRETLWCATAPKTKLQRPKSPCTCKPLASFHFLFLFFKVTHQPQWSELHWSLFFNVTGCEQKLFLYLGSHMEPEVTVMPSCCDITLIKIWWLNDFWVFSNNVSVVKETLHNVWPTFHVIFISSSRCGAAPNIRTQLCWWRYRWDLYFLRWCF